MSKTDAATRKLEDYPLWRTASHVATLAYGALEQLPEEEKWGMSFKLRRDAFDMTSTLAEALGSIDPRDQKHYFGGARKHMFSLKNACLMAHKTDVLKLDPEIIVKLNDMIHEVDAAIITATDAIPEYMKQFGPAENKELTV